MLADTPSMCDGLGLADETNPRPHFEETRLRQLSDVRPKSIAIDGSNLRDVDDRSARKSRLAFAQPNVSRKFPVLQLRRDSDDRDGRKSGPVEALVLEDDDRSPPSRRGPAAR